MTTLDARQIVTADWLVARLPGRSAREIGEGIEGLIRDGVLAVGVQLPTIRDIARAADVSPGTVLIAWNHLRAAGVIETHRRGGTVVIEAGSSDGPATPARSARSGAPAWSTVDFLQCAPDISLQPDLREALLESLTDGSLNVFGREQMTDRLLDAVLPTWPFAAQAWATAGGGTEAILLAVAATAAPGDGVAVHEPASPGLLDTLRDLGLVPIGVAADEEGPIVASLEAALDAGAVSFVFQPGAEFAIGGRVTPERTASLAAVIGSAGRPVWVVEDDAIGPLASGPSPTMGTELPDLVVRVRSYCKAYGIDVRTSVLGGSRALVERAIGLRSHGVGSNSRILQNALAHLVGSKVGKESLATARAAYRSRRDALVAALEERGVVAHASDTGLVVWVEIADETDALVALAGSGISVAPGSKVFVRPQEQGVVRISPLQLPDDANAIAELADIVARAASPSGRAYFD